MGRRGPPGAEQQQGGFSRFLSFNARKPPPAGAAGVDLGAGYQSAIHAGRGYVAAARRLAAAGAGGGLPPRPVEAVHFARWRPEEVDGLQRLGGFRSGASAATFARSASMAHMTADEGARPPCARSRTSTGPAAASSGQI